MEAEKSASILRLRELSPPPHDETDEIQESGSSLSGSGSPSLGPSSSKSSYAAPTPSPLKPSSLKSLGTGDDEGGDAAVNSIANPETSSDIPCNRSSESSGNTQCTNGGRRRANGVLSAPQQILRQKSASALHPGGISRPSTPRLLKDLGHDYSRYPSSIDVSVYSERNTPVEEPSTPLLRASGGSLSNHLQASLEEFEYPDDRLGAFNPYHGGERGFILFPHEVEDDDEFHLPADDDDITFRPKLEDYFNRRTTCSTCGAIILVLGIIVAFILVPILTFHTKLLRTGQPYAVDPNGPAWAHVNNNKYRLLRNVRRGLIDPDTPDSAKTRKSTSDDSNLELDFSDEFNQEGRTFYEGDDPFWYAPDFWYGATQDLEWYSPDAVTIANGTLQLRLDRFPNNGLDFRSGMLHSWNQLCFKGGILEISVSLAGPAGIAGLWPGAWTMGNLGRPGYLATTDGVWPYTYNSCDAGITPNQSSSDGLSYLPGQRLSSCTCKGEDHPSPGTGRGAPEIDIIEGSLDLGSKIGVVTQSFQVAPFDVWYQPNANFMALPDPTISQINTYCGGPFQQAISAVTTLNNSWYDGNSFQKYAYEYVPGTDKGKIAWFVGDDPSFVMDGRAIGPNGNVKARSVSEEPMSIVLNLGMSYSWSEIWMDKLKFPTVMHIDYVRLYQKPGQESVTCDPPGYPTTDYIAKHPKAYRNKNAAVCSPPNLLWLEMVLLTSALALGSDGL
ncbi:beta-glucan synthesis-associated protein-domain-containing protein [Leptodontidium sp. MPI-SDFR-AT-0119]|nr:beta-glucan synthesis-associated protein-domain-containing protein [Leptodontidium sp. MPI-SDFR-AT-0119]